jgi:hypothetical protein
MARQKTGISQGRLRSIEMPSFATMKANHYSSRDVNVAEVYSEIGYDAEKLIAQNGQYGNTCAIRMSLALLKSDINFGYPIGDKSRSLFQFALKIALIIQFPAVMLLTWFGEFSNLRNASTR